MTRPDPRDEALLTSVADHLPFGVWIARAPGGELVYANATFLEIMGQPGRDDVARDGYAARYGIFDRDGRPYDEAKLPFVRAVEARAEIVVDDVVIHRADGRKVAVRAVGRPIFAASACGRPAGDDDPITHVIVAFHDITREAEAEKARAESEVRLRQAQRMESIGNLAGGIAHDFNNLLAAIRLLASMLRAREQDATKIADLHRIEEVTESAVHLTRSLLGFAGRGKNLAERVPLNDVARSLVGIVRRTFDRRIDVAHELAATRPVTGDLSQLEQVVMNLMVNARDAMPEGGRLLVRTYDRGEQVVLEVLDTGTGIAPEVRERIFEPYFTTKTQGAERGIGLGLATVYGIVESHGGRIEVDSNEPRGTAMRVFFPAASDLAPAREPSRTHRAVEPPADATVLLVEDEPEVRAAATRALERSGYRVLAASDGLEALEIFRSRHDEIAAVLLDMVMPRMAGREAYLGMRAIDPRVRVLLTSGYALNDEVQSILDLGVEDFLLKPYDPTELSEALARVVRRD